jgi:transcriptional regulator with XRE-family HTH domain
MGFRPCLVDQWQTVGALRFPNSTAELSAGRGTAPLSSSGTLGLITNRKEPLSVDVRRETRCDRCGKRLAHDNAGGYCAPCQVGSPGRDLFAAAPDVPAQFWDSHAMRDALASRHMGRVIRAYRHHPFHGRRPLPQDVVGVWIGVTQGQLSRIENGPTIVHLDRLMHWARVLGIPSSCLWFTLPEDDQATPIRLGPAAAGWSAPITVNDGDVSLWWAPADTVEIVSQFTRRDLTVDRREAARLLAGVVFGSELLEPLERWLSAGPEKLRAGRSGSVGYQEVEQIEKAARIFRDWDDQFGGGLRRKAVVGQLNEVADLLGDAHPAGIQRRLFGVMAQLAETGGMMSWDSGLQALAQRYYVLAIRASRAADDRIFGANVMAAMARQLLYLGHAGDALELVRLAQDHSAGYAPASVRSMLYTREAWAYAGLGRVSAFRRVTGRAEDALTEAKPAEDPYWITYFDVAELEGTTGGRLLELAHHDKRLADEAAGRISQAVVLRRDGRLRSSALDQIGLAEVRLIQGEMEEASRLGHQACALVERTPSDRVRVKLTKFYQHSNAHADVPVIAGLRDRIRSLCASAPA